MKDVQNSADTRGIAIQKVGIRDAHLPLLIKTKEGDYQQVLANISFTVSLPMEYKGTHMSRFQEILNKWTRLPIAEVEMADILLEAMDKLQAETAAIHIEFKYFVDRFAPVSKRKSVLDVDCFFDGVMEREQPLQFTLGVKVPYTSLCPCSKEISEYGAHNQRGLVKVKLLYKDFFWIEDVISAVEAAASSPLYSVLKRQDEKYVTEHAYDNPRFVEDVVREVYLALKKMNFNWFSVECTNDESIHNHDAYAYTEFSQGEKSV